MPCVWTQWLFGPFKGRCLCRWLVGAPLYIFYLHESKVLYFLVSKKVLKIWLLFILWNPSFYSSFHRVFGPPLYFCLWFPCTSQFDFPPSDLSSLWTSALNWSLDCRISWAISSQAMPASFKLHATLQLSPHPSQFQLLSSSHPTKFPFWMKTSLFVRNFWVLCISGWSEVSQDSVSSHRIAHITLGRCWELLGFLDLEVYGNACHFSFLF